MHRVITLLAACLTVAACATSPLDTSGVNSRDTPGQIVEAMPGQRGARVQWGGRIVSTTNRDRATIIEVLSYPLARDGLPNAYSRPTGRFVLRRGGFSSPRTTPPDAC